MSHNFIKIKKGRKGFTLIELVMMISLLGIMVVLYTESAGDLSNVGVDAASRKAQSDIRYAQLLAQSTGVNHGARFVAGGGYEVYRVAPGAPVNSPVDGQPLVENFVSFPGVSISTNYQVEYNASGRPVMGQDTRVRLKADSGAIRDVYVVDQTGAVVVDLIQKGTGCACEIANRNL